MSGVAMAKVILDQPEIIARIRECESTEVRQYVRMDWGQSGVRRPGRDQVIDGLACTRLAALGYEKPGKAVGARCQIALDRAKFVTRDRLFDGESVLEAPNPEAGLIEVDVVAAQADRLADAQAVAVHHQHQQVISDAVSPPLGGLEQARHLGLVQEILAPLMGISGDSGPGCLLLNRSRGIIDSVHGRGDGTDTVR